MSGLKTDKTLILLRGLPGSGKTTLAHLLSENGLYPIVSIDDYFTDEKGDYNFEFSENHKAYKSAVDRVEAMMDLGNEKIIVHNVFSMDWEMEPYFKAASSHGYTVFVATVENYHDGQNSHGVSAEQLEKMAEKFKVKLL